MNKSELAQELAKRFGTSPPEAALLVDAVEEIVGQAIERGEDVVLGRVAAFRQTGESAGSATRGSRVRKAALGVPAPVGLDAVVGSVRRLPHAAQESATRAAAVAGHTASSLAEAALEAPAMLAAAIRAGQRTLMHSMPPPPEPEPPAADQAPPPAPTAAVKVTGARRRSAPAGRSGTGRDTSAGQEAAPAPKPRPARARAVDTGTRGRTPARKSPGPEAPGPEAPGPTAPGPEAPGPEAPGPKAPGPESGAQEPSPG